MQLQLFNCAFCVWRLLQHEIVTHFTKLTSYIEQLDP